ncbi:heavy-metal-associated domain-containing protein [Granulicoccus sp. GXG6511]|uniref:heavy-metal-associated domain-containing protein n=1 Tax=Granulicoccus sp. GXG6511 TaxID=3381351 RepID=UPI003D7EC111
MATTNYTVTGMTCGHCVNAVTEEVSELEGVTDVNVQLDSGTMVVESAERLPLSSIAEAVSEAGDYTVVEA